MKKIIKVIGGQILKGSIPLKNCTNNLNGIRMMSTTSNPINTLNVTVDGISVSVPIGSTVLQACEAAGAEIPRFCYHERLSVAGNCRMCLVEVEKSPKPVASCAMPAMNGMIVHTNTAITKKARESVMEFLLVNHPLDCPICDQAGECDLQDQSLVFGNDRSRFTDIFHEGKRAIEDKNMGPLISAYMTRCIQCTRCVRFCNQVAGVEELGMNGRGTMAQIGTYVDKPCINSELTGNLVDICPVGALTSKPYSFVARSWELRKTESIDIHDAIGSNIRIDSKNDKVVRILPRLNEEINEEWISDKSRYSCDALCRQRLVIPLVRKIDTNSFEEKSWMDALDFIVNELLKSCCNNNGCKKNNNDSSIIKSFNNDSRLFGIVGGIADAEIMTALRDFIHGKNSNNLYMEQTLYLGTGNTGDLRESYLFNESIQSVEDCDTILLIGTNPRFEAPLLNTRIRKAYVQNDARIGVIGDLGDLNYSFENLGDSLKVLDEISKGKHEWSNVLKKGKKVTILLGQSLFDKDEKTSERVFNSIREIKSFVENGSKKNNDEKDESLLLKSSMININLVHQKASTVAALDLGYQSNGLPNDINENDVVILAGVDDRSIIEKVKGAFVVYIGHHGDNGAQIANVVLPSMAYTESYGIYENMEGRPQTTIVAVTGPGQSRVGWKIVRALAELSGVNLCYDNIDEIRERIAHLAPGLVKFNRIQNPIKDIIGNRFVKLENCNDSLLYEKSIACSISQLSDFFMTDVISRNSPTMASCSLAATKKAN